ncbi:MAG: NifU family protein [Bacteroidales bacterium]|nr:NifU family protein [Bacteroidales bacterium]
MNENLSLEDKVKSAIEQIRPYLQQDGGDVLYSHIDQNNVVFVKLIGACHGCPMAMQTLKMGIEAALKEVIPEINGVESI